MDTKAADRELDEGLRRLLALVRRVRALSTRESAAMFDLLAKPDGAALARMREAHFDEVDAIHALGAAVEILMRRREKGPALRGEPARPSTAPLDGEG